MVEDRTRDMCYPTPFPSRIHAIWTSTRVVLYTVYGAGMAVPPHMYISTGHPITGYPHTITKTKTKTIYYMEANRKRVCMELFFNPI